MRKKRIGWRRWIQAAILGAIMLTGSGAPVAGEPSPVVIGVLATMSREHCLDQWTATADYLSREIPEFRFRILPLTYEKVEKTVKTDGVDFILANPSFYVLLESRYGANRIATLKNRCSAGVCKTYGGVVFWLKNRRDIQGLADLKGKRFMAADEHSLGGWLTIWRELKERGFDPQRDFSSLEFGNTHDAVVNAVLEGRMDAGGVRTDILERMAAEGRIRLETVRVLPRRQTEATAAPFLCSTREYPEWPMAKLRGTTDSLAEKVTIALLRMPPDSGAAVAARCSGWTIPLNYQSVHECLRYLKVGPYEKPDQITAGDVIRTYWRWLLAAAMAFAGGGIFTLVILRLNRKIRDSHQRLKAEIIRHRRTDEALTKAKEQAEAATHAKSEFLANMSHEIRTPMNGVIAAAELALNEPLSPKAERYVKIIHSSAHSLLNLINDILDFSKIEAGKLSMETRSFMLDEVVDRVVNLFANSAAEKRIELLVDIDPQTPAALLGDPMRLQQILTNLVGNAVKFTEKPGFILIGATPAEQQPQQVEIQFRVKDVGVGIPEDYLARLFNPFTQADTSDTRRYEGTGLGLSICKRLVGLMGGTIWVESRMGCGSTFYFTARFGRRPSESVHGYTPPEELRNLTILVVDDCTESLAIVTRMLGSFGFTVRAASSGTEALKTFFEQPGEVSPADLAILDWMMPETDGLELAEAIRARTSAAIPIILMTAFGREVEKMRAEKAGITGFIYKPIYPSTLFNAVLDAFGLQGVTPHLSPASTPAELSAYKRSLKGFRLLVVEDNPTNREIAVAILESAGMLTETAMDGLQAVEMVTSRPFDAVLMDVQMPNLNGYDATRQIRRNPDLERLPIIAMTARAMRGDEELCLAAGMNGYIAKPISQHRLFQLLWRLLKDRRPDMGEIPREPEVDETGNSPAVMLPEAVPGLYIREAMAETKLAAPVYLKIVNGFFNNNRATADNIQQAFQTGDNERLYSLAHTLTGSAAGIGARDLAAAARQLEHAARSGQDPASMSELIAAVRGELETVLAAIPAIREYPTAPAGGPTLPRPGIASSRMTALLSQLSTALGRSDPQEINRLMAELSSCPESGKVGALERLVQNYDYEEAVRLVDEWLHAVNPTATPDE
ncbi:MAG: response regulator [Thermodesulfobacteriota bacterium]